MENEKVYTYIQSRFYRSPEVILGKLSFLCDSLLSSITNMTPLGLAYNTAIDMWSLGCILAELFTGYPLFPGENEQEQLACIMEIQGVPNKYLIEKSTRKKLFFGKRFSMTNGLSAVWKLNRVPSFTDSYGNPRIGPNSKGKKRRPGSKTLAQALKCTDEPFLDFVSKCLEWDPEKRLNPEQGLAHPWIASGDHVSSRYSSSASIATSGTSKGLPWHPFGWKWCSNTKYKIQNTLYTIISVLFVHVLPVEKAQASKLSSPTGVHIYYCHSIDLLLVIYSLASLWAAKALDWQAVSSRKDGIL